MTPERFAQVRAIFDQIVDLSAAERERMLHARCAGDSDVRALVERLLAQADRPTAPIDVRPLASPLQSVIDAAVAPPDRVTSGVSVGAFRIIRPIGRGGMGEVFEAEQQHPQRRVALKLLRADLLTPESRRRFELEAHVLGRLQHPGIACIHEAGVYELPGGPRPYFAMELIRGQPLDEHATTARLPVRNRLDLFARVCEAVEHAHRAGVVHRDLKPSNILVDESGQPKIVDFGVARFVHEGDVARSMHTVAGQLVGTLAYMSPEQVTGDAHIVDSRSDVYGLGVVLFELLAGRLPLDVTGRPLPEVARMIREDEPTSLGTVSSLFRGDLDTITGKALEKDPARRYASAGELAADIRRFLRDEPVIARPPTTTYQLRKFARRHRELVAGVAAAFLILIVGLATVSWFAIREARQRRLADARTREALWASYRNGIAAGDSSTRMGDAPEAARLLDSTPVDARGWEWSYLRLRSDRSTRTITASSKAVRSVAIVDKTVWTGDDDGWIRRWDCDTGGLVAEQRAHDSGVVVLIAPTQGERCYSASAAGEVAAWDRARGALLWRARASGAVHDQAVLASGKEIAVPMPQRVGFLDSRTGTEIRSFSLPVASVDNPIVDPTGQALLCRVNDVHVCFHLASGRELWRRSGWFARFSGRGTEVTLYSGLGRGVTTVDTFTGATIVEMDDVTGLPWGSAGNRLATVIGTTVRLLDPADGRVVLELPGHSTNVVCLSADEGSSVAATSDSSGLVKLWDARDSARPFTIRSSNDAVRAGRVAPDGTRAVTAGWGCVKLWNLVDGAERWSTFVLKRVITSTEFSPDGAKVAAGGHDGVVVVLDARDGTEITRTPMLGASIAGLAWSRQEPGLLAALPDGRLAAIRAERGDAVEFIRTPLRSLSSIAASPDGRSIVLGGAEGAWISTTDRPLFVALGVMEPEHGPRSLVFDPPGTRVGMAGADGAISIWNAAQRTRAWRREQPGQGGVEALAFTPDGRRLAAGFETGVVRLLDAQSGDALLDLREPASAVRALGFAGDGGSLGVVCVSPPGAIVVYESVHRPSYPGLRERHGQVRAHVDRLFAELHFEDAVVAAIEREPQLPREQADDAIRLARARGDQPNYLNSEAWTVVRFPNRSRADYLLALAKAEHAHRIRPDEHAYLNTLAFAQIRAGKPEAAIESFRRCIAMPRTDGRPAHPIDQLGLAVAHALLGDHRLAAEQLQSARETMKAGHYTDDPEYHWVIAEAESHLKPSSATSP